MGLTRQTSPRALGHTLLEMMLSLVLLSIVMASVSSAMMFASSAVPDEDGPVATLTRDSEVIGRIAEDIAAATHVIEQTSHTITIVVPDRTGDGMPDRVRYAWTGNDGDPLTCEINDELAVTVLESVAVFNLDATIGNSVRTIPGVPETSGSETLIDSFDLVLLTSPTTGIDSVNQAGQLTTPSLSSGVTGFIPSRVEFRAKKQGGSSGEMVVEVASANDGTPTSTVYSTGSISENDLTNSLTWYSIDMTGTATIPSDQQIALVFSASDTSSATVANLHYNLGSGGMITSTNGGASYSNSLLNTVYYRLYGYEQTSSNAWDIEYDHTTMVTVSLQSAAERREPLTRSVRMMLAPPIVDAFAEADFATAPTALDLNDDGRADWSHSAGSFLDGSLTNGVWTANGQLVFAADDLSSAGVITVNARMRSNDTLGPTIYGPYTIDNSGDLLPMVTQLRSDGAGGQELAIYNDTTMTTEAAVISGLPAGFVDIRLILLPKENTLGIQINHEMVGSVLLERISGTGSVDQDFRFGSSGGVAEFDSISVRVGGTYSTNSDASGIDLSDLFQLIFP